MPAFDDARPKAVPARSVFPGPRSGENSVCGHVSAYPAITVIPAKAGTQIAERDGSGFAHILPIAPHGFEPEFPRPRLWGWAPAFAGMTVC